VAYFQKPGLYFLLIWLVLFLSACSSSSSNKAPVIELKYDLSEASQLILLKSSNIEIKENSTDTYVSNFVGLGPDNKLYSLIQSEHVINVDHVATSLDKSELYLSISTSDDGLKYSLQQNCSLYKVTLSDNSARCILHGNFLSKPSEIDKPSRFLKNKNSTFQFDSDGNVYVLAQRFLKNCNKSCTTGDALSDYTRQENNVRQGYYLQNQVQVYRIDREGEKEVFTLNGATPIALRVLKDRLLALFTNTAEQTNLHIIDEGVPQSLTLPAGIESVIVDDVGNLILNDSLLMTPRNGEVQWANINHTLREHTDLRLSDTMEIYDTVGSSIYRTLPFEVRPVAQLNSNENSLVFLDKYIFEYLASDVLVHDTYTRETFDLATTLDLTNSDKIMGDMRHTNGMLIFTVKNLDTEELSLLELPSNTLSKTNILTSDIMRFTLSDSTNSIENLIVLDSNTAQVDFKIDQWFGFAENSNSITAKFSSPIEASGSQLINVDDSDSNATEFSVIQLGAYIHIFPDVDGKINNELIDGEVLNHAPMDSGLSYEVVANSSIKNIFDRALVQTQSGENFPNNFAVQTAPEGGVYFSNVSSFSHQYSELNAEISSDGLIAKPVCKSDSCSSYYYNLGVERAGNVRIEFSTSGTFSQLALWDSVRYGWSYNRQISPVYAFWADTTSANMKNTVETLTHNLIDSDDAILVNENLWRRYRFDYYGNNLTVSYSLDGKVYTVLEELKITDAENYISSSDEYHWLMEFDGALDNLSVSLLDTAGNLLTSTESELLNETFDEKTQFSSDRSADNGKGFEENIAQSLPLAPGGSGTTDTSFGERGLSTFPHLTQSFGRFTPEKILSDGIGNIYTAGRVSNGVLTYLAIWKTTINGQLDANFGSEGIYIYDEIESEAYDLSLSASNQLYVAGITYDGTDSNLSIWRFDLDGSLDVSFGTNGLVTYATAQNEIVYSMIMDAEDNIYLGGSSGPDLTVWKYDKHGVQSDSFNSNGLLSISSSGDDSAVVDIALDANNNILLAGYQQDSAENYNAVLYQVSQAGIVVTTVDFNVLVGFSSSAVLSAIKFDNMARLLAFGYQNDGGAPDLFLARLNSDYSLDASFAENGVWSYDSGGSDFSYSIELDSSDRIYLQASTQSTFLELIRLLDSGENDLTFGRSGYAYFSAKAADLTLVEFDSTEQLMVMGDAIGADLYPDQIALWLINLD